MDAQASSSDDGSLVGFLARFLVLTVGVFEGAVIAFPPVKRSAAISRGIVCVGGGDAGDFSPLSDAHWSGTINDVIGRGKKLGRTRGPQPEHGLYLEL